MELGTGMYVFFIATSIIGVGIALVFSVDGLSAKFNKIFEDDTRK